MLLSPDQQAGSDQFMDFLLDDTKLEIAIFGPGGTGKSYLTKHLINAAYKQIQMLEFLIDEDCNLSIHLTATTNKAAKVLSSLTSADATTIHTLLGLKVVNDYRTGKVNLQRTKNSNIIHNSIIFIDEASMVNTQLLKLIREQTCKCKLVFIGDSYQLAPVKETTCPVFTEVKNQVKLTTIQRQVAGSPIIQLGSGYRGVLDGGAFPKLETMDEAIKVVSGPAFKEYVDEYYKNMPDNESKIIAWRNQRVHQYNDYVRSLFTAEEEFIVGEKVVTNKPILDHKGMIVASTESILEVLEAIEATQYDIDGWFVDLSINKYEVRVFQPRFQHEVKGLLKIYAADKNWYDYFAKKEFFADLRPIHSCTTHKSQGSTYDTTFIDVGDIGGNGKVDELARMMYVAVTRARSNIILTGDLPKRFY